MTNAVLDTEKIATREGVLTVYNFDAKTAEYIGASDELLAVGVGLPACSTDIDPGIAPEGSVYVFAENKWTLTEDHRGETVYSVSTGSASVVDYLGPVKEGFVTAAPASKYDVWNGNAWVTDDDAKRQADIEAAGVKQQNLRAVADASISWLQDAADLGEATEKEAASLTAWKKYRVALMRIDSNTAPEINWPEMPS
ncbi:tail fiber assembly protein [Cronobacter turicensis]